jgi:hypothetical protein
MDGDQLPQIIKLQAQLLRQKAMLYLLTKHYTNLLNAHNSTNVDAVDFNNKELDSILETKPEFFVTESELKTTLSLRK